MYERAKPSWSRSTPTMTSTALVVMASRISAQASVFADGSRAFAM
ncbi:hypothetical protein [Streptomyces sp. wa1063]